MEKIAIIGAGASGEMTAILLRKKYPNLQIDLFDGNQEEGKKILLTGNGRCNLGNDKIEEQSYRYPWMARKVLDHFPLIEQRAFFHSLGLLTRMEGYLCYPYSFRAKTVRDFLWKAREKSGIHFYMEKVVDYHATSSDVEIITKEQKRKYDFAIFATGGASYPRTGSDGRIFDLLKKKGYSISPLQPGLCPIRVKEKVASLQGNRARAVVSIRKNNEKLYEEKGEVLWKKDGLSGIVILNISSLIARHAWKDITISLDLLYDISKEEWMKQNTGVECPLYGVFTKEIADYILKTLSYEKKSSYSKKEWESIYQRARNLSFTYVSHYGFEDSQVTIGGIRWEEIDDHFISKREKNIAFVGEILDNDGLCGGYNLMWAFASAKWLVDAL